ncbi:MAG: TetR/AcrR family transcriptional regulator [Actinomycetota bacterium]|nr:TetR/AcrR family transcriptional regulator [Actinomycetota bacterium]MEC9395186.1 TetR/AcrR family transcriptional regulator [Actinomycetota bacterium]MED6328848.1 TetR/AcrR family transcriptional regulator [Actinomycetota bacterium]MEE2957390.1 TetR/AcrR family transcriptional regulator [Actinomycetota bacterium]
MIEGGPRPRGSAEVREALVAAAARLLGGSAPERISGRRLAEEAGVNYGLVHHYFGGKNAVLREGFRRLADDYAAESGLATASHVAPFSLRNRPDFVRALAYASLSGEADDAHVDHPTLDAALDRALAARPADDPTEVRIDVGLATVFHLARCLFAPTVDPWTGNGQEDLSSAVEERLVLVLRSLTLGLDPGRAVRGERESVRRSSAPD